MLTLSLPGRGDRKRAAVIAVMVCCAALLAWSVFLRPTHKRAMVYTWDTAAYIDCARSILEGRGFMQRTIAGTGRELWEPISWWPPGYPLLVAGVKWLGIADLPQAGVVVAVMSAAAAIVLLSLICLQVFHWKLALPVVLCIVMMPPFFQISVTCMSDASYLMLSSAAVLCMLKWSRRQSWHWLAAAGLLAGLSWGNRNVAIALLAAMGLFVLLHAAWLSRRAMVFSVVAFGSAAAAGLAPFVIRNLTTFGRINPYDMPPSELTVWDNIAATAAVIVRDVTGTSTFRAMFSNGTVVASMLAAIGVAAAAGLVWTHRASVGAFVRRHRVVLFCALLFVLHLAVVIAARSRFRWGEPIVSRHTMQVYWVMWIGLGLAAAAVLQWAGLNAVAARRVLIVLFVLAAARQVQQQVAHLRLTPPGAAISLQNQFGVEGATFLAHDVKPNQIVLANYADLLRTHCNINSRKIPPVAEYAQLSPLTHQQLDSLGRSGFLWGLAIADVPGTLRGDYDHLVRDMLQNPQRYPEFERVPTAGPAAIFKYVGDQSALQAVSQQ